MFYSADTLKTQSPEMCLVAQSCPILCHLVDCSPPGFSVHGEPPGKNTGVSCHALLHGLFLTQGSNPGLPHCRRILYILSHLERTIYSVNLSFTIRLNGKHLRTWEYISKLIILGPQFHSSFFFRVRNFLKILEHRLYHKKTQKTFLKQSL